MVFSLKTRKFQEKTGGKRGQYLLEDVDGALLQVLEDEVHLVCGGVVDDFVQLADVRVVEALHDGDLLERAVEGGLPTELACVVPRGTLACLREHALVHDLNCVVLLRRVVEDKLDLPVLPAAKLVDDCVLVDRFVPDVVLRHNDNSDLLNM